MLAATEGVAHVMSGARTTEGLISVLAEVDVEAADEVIEVLGAFELPEKTSRSGGSPVSAR